MITPEFNPDVSSVDRYNRGNDNKVPEGKLDSVSIGLQTIDTAILKYLQEKIKPVVTQDNKQIPVPILYGNPERWKSAQQDGGIRDKNGKILLPIMMLRRTTMKKNTISSPVNKYNNYIFKSGWNARNAYDKFAALNKITPSEMYHSTMMPDYYDITYDAMIWTEYMEQMNKVVENISYESDEYWGDNTNYRFITSIDQFEQVTELPQSGDRLVRSKFSIMVKAYILPKSALDRNGNRTQTTKIAYSPKKVVFSTEIVGSIQK